MKLSDKISLAIMAQCNSTAYDILLPNFYFYPYEMDVFKVSDSGIVTEFEIKISKSDFLADFKKGNKHELLKTGKLTANRFYFVVPEGLVKREDLPDHAGLMTFSGAGFLTTIKNAPLLHKRKFTDYKQLAGKLSFREANHRASLRSLQRHLNEKE